MVATRADALHAFERFVTTHTENHPSAMQTLAKDNGALLTFYDFPAEQWRTLLPTNAIELACATVRHRKVRVAGDVPRTGFHSDRGSQEVEATEPRRGTNGTIAERRALRRRDRGE